MQRFIRHTILAAAVSALALTAGAQQYMTRTGRVTFFSTTPAEDIEAINNESAAVLDGKTGAVSFQVPIKSFKFERRLMQDHFNENYMESDTYPKASFTGGIRNPEAIRYTKDGVYEVQAAGTLTIHGVSKEVTIPGTMTVKDGTVTIYSQFMVRPADYKIRIPSVVAAKIAEEVKVTVNTILKEK